MASPTLTMPRDMARSNLAQASDENVAWWLAKTVVSTLASLKITVTLLALGVFIIFVGTLAQAEMDMWEVMARYFRAWICFVPFDVFFPPAWFPHGYLSESLGFAGNRLPSHYTFPCPGGSTIGMGLFINLTAAYIWHFRLQARNLRELLLGLVLLGLGLLISLAVVWSGHNSHGLQAEPLLSWGVMWTGFQGVLVLAVVGLAALGVVLPAARQAERFGAFAGAALIASLLLALYYSGASMSVNPSSVRILWQISKGIFAGLVLLSAGLLLYHKRGGVVTMHLGVAMLMFGEFFVSYYNNEEQMSIEEGRTVNYAMDIRSNELVFVDPTDKDFDRVIAIPQQRLKVGEWITDSGLPCEVRIDEYAPNSQLQKRTRDNPPPKDYQGLARLAEIRPTAGASGASADGKVNLASALVSLRTRGGEPLGTYLLTQAIEQQSETVKVGNTPFEMALRFKRTYKPYQVELTRVSKDDYLGTDTPRNYSSDVRFLDPLRNADFEKHIWMNNPLRYAGETFYQSGYHRDRDTGRQYTTLQVVTNRGWMIPYLACGVVIVGMLAQFCLTLYRFLGRYVFPPLPAERVLAAELIEPAGTMVAPADKRKVEKPKAKAERTPALLPVKRRSWILPAVICLLCALWPVSQMFRPKESADDFHVVSFGRVPVVYEGRVKPFDTLARSLLRRISKSEEYTDQGGHTQPAIRWLLAVLSGKPEAEKLAVFRIEDPQLRETLGLEPRFGQRYSIDEIRPKFDELDRQAKLARQGDEKDLSTYQKRLIELYEKLQLFVALRQGHQLPDPKLRAPEEQANELLSLMHMQNEFPATRLPLAAPTKNVDLPWEPLGKAATRAYAQNLAAQYGAKTPSDLAANLAGKEPTASMRQALLRRIMVEQVAAIIKTQMPNADPETLLDQAEILCNRMPADKRALLEQDAAAEVSQRWIDFKQQLASNIGLLLNTEPLTAAPNPATVALANMLQAYGDERPEKFNAALTQYAAATAEFPAAEEALPAMNFEQWYNYGMPCYTAIVVYVMAFVLVCLSWLLLSPNLSRSAYWVLLLAFTLHTLAILARISISGRPPVTNLYSSAVFIGWGFVLVALVLEKIFPLGIASAVGAVGGFLTLLIAHFLALDGDTFTVMQAVLDTQFWLATHVVCITLGYTATFAAGFLGVVYILGGHASPFLNWRVGRLFDAIYGAGNAEIPASVRNLSLSKLLATMIYGVLCFALFFSLWGTVLGGLWADDSWGRFWGWDPKENGALIIVLWNAIILHCRWDKMVRDRGLAVLAVVGNIVTAWSWFGVNELGIGLHSYGFTEGRLLFLARFVVSQLVLVGFGLIPTSYWWSFRTKSRESEPLMAEMA